MKLIPNTASTVKFFIVISGIVLLGLTLQELQHIFLPFIVAYMFFFLFSPLNNWLTAKKIPLFLVIPFNLVIITVIFAGAGTILYTSFIQIGDNLPAYYNKLNLVVREFSISLGIKDPYFRKFNLERVIDRLDYKTLAADFLSFAADLTTMVFFIIIFFAFIVSGHKAIYTAIKKRYVTEKSADTEEADSLSEPVYYNEARLEATFREITQQIQRYIITKVSINLSAGVVVGLVLWLIGLDFPLVWGILTVLLNFVPTIGSVFSLVLPVLMALIQYDAPGYALLLGSIIILIQTIFFNVLEPVFVGKNLGLNPIAILLSVLVWGYIWGVAGMLLAVPLTAIIKIMISNSHSRNLQFINELMSNRVSQR
ncbi:MAG: hypothetical protein AMXMBFR48_04610 [Ignavibacteriales bacterium]